MKQYDTVVADEKEQIEIAYTSATVDTLGDDVSANELQTELDKTAADNSTIYVLNESVKTELTGKYSEDKTTIVNM